MTTNSNFRVKNNLEFTNTGTGITFADGSTQTTASTGTGGVSSFDDLTNVPANLLNLATGTNVTLSTQVETSVAAGGETFLALGNSLTDTSGNAITMTVNGTAAYNQSDASTPITGQNVFTFPGLNNSNIQLDTLPESFGTNDFTIDFWFYANQFGNNSGDTYSAVLSNWSSGGPYFLLNTAADQQLYFFIGYATPMFNTAPVTLNTWHHAALTRESGVFKLWFDGVLAATNNTYTGQNVNFSSTMFIGSEDGSNRAFDGKVAGIRILKGEVLFTTTFTPPSTAADYALHNGAPIITTSTVITSLTVNTATVAAIKFGDNTVMTTAPTGGASYDQSLNTTDSVVFAGLRVNGTARMNAIIADDDTQKIVLSSNTTGEGSGAGGVLVVGSSNSDVGNKITINANAVEIQNLTYPSADGTDGQVLTTNGAGSLSWTTATSGGAVGQTEIYSRDSLPAGTTGTIITISDSGTDLNNGTVNGVPAYWDIDDGLWRYVANNALVQEPLNGVPVEFLVVAGGGGGGEWNSGGGGAGGLLTGTQLLSFSTAYTITVGAGGAGGTGGSGPAGASGSQGSNSVFDTTTTIGGGGGGAYFESAPTSGGSGGGAGWITQAGGAGTAGQGNAGGTSVQGGPPYKGSGGGGAGAAGENNAGGSAGVGGIGLQSSITGTATYYAGGGGSGGNGAASDGGLGGGGAGGAPGNNGTINTGGGGGGGGTTTTGGPGGNGGSGVVIIRHLDTFAAATATTGSPDISVVGAYRIYKFTSSGTITF